MQKKFLSLMFVSALLAALGSVSATAAIYKTTDEDGNVVFTDVPPKDQSGEVDVTEQNVYTPPALPAAPAQAVDPESADDEAAGGEAVATTYEALSITSPADDEPVRENAGNVTIVVRATPALDTSQGHQLEILLDGLPASNGAAASVSLTNVDRGTHVVTARITDADGNVLIASQPVTFHMLRYSALRRPAS